MNTLAPADAADQWRLPQHAHIVVYEREGGRGLLTIYDCAAAQKPPSAQLLGDLGSVRAAHEVQQNPTGYVVRMREPSVLAKQDENHWVVRPVSDS
ncbi:hypothetical protein [Haloarchaeobius sp. HME9146]|uniref:hypothetical protein n=1 Tax=Haloarchaeobius sp. HME9146 TaxID=2978732 RepID=UPI0021C14913|nr:hypothetical protein [Haloarchaeobius sp. HME9146]MCT9097861.1 hypothetical protein [Haloarchaeobius sp. HME9146]